MKVGDLRKAIEGLDDDVVLTITAPNAPPWITEFRIAPIATEVENE